MSDYNRCLRGLNSFPRKSKKRPQHSLRYSLNLLKRPNAKTNRTRGKGRSLAGVWSDLAWDDEAEAFDRMRHATQPTPPIEL